MRRMAPRVGAKDFSPLRAVMVMMALALVGCATKQEPVRVTVPVPCAVQLPQRPPMPTESLSVDVALDDFVAAAAAEIERREGYEVQLRAALGACMDGHVGAKNLSPLRGGNEAQQ